MGPARISSYDLYIGEHKYEDYLSAKTYIENIVGGDKNVSFSYRSPGAILASQERVVMITISLDRFTNDQQILGAKFLPDPEICYCSIYDECWSVSVSSDKPKEGC